MENLTPEQIYDHVLKYVEKRLKTNGVTTAVQLDAVCRETFKSEWAGVYPADKLPELNAKKCKAIHIVTILLAGISRMTKFIRM
jgi:hypothetical protein